MGAASAAGSSRRPARRGIGAAAVIVAGLIGVTGCANGSAGAHDDVTAALVRSADFDRLHALGFSDAQVQATAECVAEQIRPKFSPAALQAITTGKYEQELSKDDYAALSAAIYDCARAESGDN